MAEVMGIVQPDIHAEVGPVVVVGTAVPDTLAVVIAGSVKCHVEQLRQLVPSFICNI